VRLRAINLVLVSFLALFFELALIRWLAAEIKVFAYLKNLVLIAAFLGLGLGFFLARRRIGLLPLFLPLASILIGTVLVGTAFGLWQTTVLPSGEQLVLLGLSFSWVQAAPLLLQFVVWIPYYAITLFYFLLVTIVFIPLGQYAGKCIRAFAPLPGYSLNLLGSLAGTILFTIVSFAWLPPSLWFALAGLTAIILLRNTLHILWRLNLGLALGFLAAVFLPDSTIWSPYHNLRLSPLTISDPNGQQVPWGYQLSIGSYYYQDLVDLSPTFFEEHPNLPEIYRHSEYEVPYKFLCPTEVLILGAGAGNDAAAALRNGARAVDAVDIDPAIMRIGEEFHPERPYASPKVTRIVDDARAYVRRTNKTYDLVLFGLLDSQQVLSAFGSVRLDNFVYTVEGMREAYTLVKPGGILAVAFEIFEPWIADRINGIMEMATGQKPLIIQAHHGTVFLVRRGSAITSSELDSAIKQLGSEANPRVVGTSDVPLTTDDWPYLYLRSRELPLAYASILPILVVVAVGMVRRVFRAGQQVQWHFFFLGAAFMLMEVRIIGEVALLFGSTWVVNAVAIASVLVMAISANVLVAAKKFKSLLLWGILLLATLMASSLVPSSVFLSWNQGFGGMAAALVLAMPVFFSGVVFSVSFRQTTAVDNALASNLSGAILGGFTEYLSLLWGNGSLAWMAAILYALALVAKWGESRTS